MCASGWSPQSHDSTSHGFPLSLVLESSGIASYSRKIKGFKFSRRSCIAMRVFRGFGGCTLRITLVYTHQLPLRILTCVTVGMRQVPQHITKYSKFVLAIFAGDVSSVHLLPESCGSVAICYCYLFSLWARRRKKGETRYPAVSFLAPEDHCWWADCTSRVSHASRLWTWTRGHHQRMMHLQRANSAVRCLCGSSTQPT